MGQIFTGRSFFENPQKLIPAKFFTPANLRKLIPTNVFFYNSVKHDITFKTLENGIIFENFTSRNCFYGQTRENESPRNVLDKKIREN